MIRTLTRKRASNRNRNEIMSIGYDGLPQLFKIVKWNTVKVNGKDSPYHTEFVPIYKRCKCCEMALGRLEIEHNFIMGGYCEGCFKNVTEQTEFGPFGEVLCPNGMCNELKSLENKDLIKIKQKSKRSTKKRMINND